jgi:hypothetical protein
MEAMTVLTAEILDHWAAIETILTIRNERPERGSKMGSGS